MKHGSREYILDSALVAVSNGLHLDLDRVKARREKLAKKVQRLLEQELAIERSIAAIHTVRGEIVRGKILPIKQCVSERCECDPHVWTVDRVHFFCEGREGRTDPFGGDYESTR